ncbi:MAG: hypothetical protein GXO15_06380 [Crenarchaeota archaeon]|nr:hypothetical protein [Thermoproteota archaeon]
MPQPLPEPSLILDIEELSDHYVIHTRDGEKIIVEKDRLPRSLYWKVKLRNRRTGFGI